MKKIIWRSIEY